MRGGPSTTVEVDEVIEPGKYRTGECFNSRLQPSVFTWITVSLELAEKTAHTAWPEERESEMASGGAHRYSIPSRSSPVDID